MNHKISKEGYQLERPALRAAKLPAAKWQRSTTTGRNLVLPTKLDDVTYNRHAYQIHEGEQHEGCSDPKHCF